MLYMHDVWVNWFNGAIKPYEVPEFHEWRKTDEVQLLDQVPLIPVKSSFFEYVEDGMNELPHDLIEETRGKAFLRKNHERVECRSIVICDGEKALLFDTGGYAIPVKKSRLIPRQEELALEMVRGLPPIKFEFTTLPPEDDDILGHTPNKYMYGLTRTERELKSLLLDNLAIVAGNRSSSELKYLYSEYDYDLYKQFQENERFDTMFKDLLVLVAYGWSEKHLNLLKAAVKSDKAMQKEFDDILVAGKVK